MSKSYAGYFLEERQSSHNTEIEYWTASNKTSNPIGWADVYMMPHSYKNILENIPRYGVFAPFSLIEQKNRLVVVVPRTIQLHINDIQERVGVTGLVCFMWHVSAHLGELHQVGRAHGILHASHIGIDGYGKVSIRPAFADFIPSEPDSTATATATDCWQLFFVLQSMGIDSSVDSRFSLLMRGLQQDIARLRLQPATAIRQTITAVLARHVEWETKFIAYFGADWKLEVFQKAEESVIPHRLEKYSKKEYSKPTPREEFDVWGNPFVSQRSPSQSSAQALLQQAFQSVPKMHISLPALDVLVEEDMDVEKGRLQIDLQTSNSPLQLQIQEEALSSTQKFSSIRAIEEIYDDQDIPTKTNPRFDVISIVEEYDRTEKKVVLADAPKTLEPMPIVSPEIHIEEDLDIVEDIVDSIGLEKETVETNIPETNIVEVHIEDVEEDTEHSDEDMQKTQAKEGVELSMPVDIAQKDLSITEQSEREHITEDTTTPERMAEEEEHISTIEVNVLEMGTEPVVIGSAQAILEDKTTIPEFVEPEIAPEIEFVAMAILDEISSDDEELSPIVVRTIEDVAVVEMELHEPSNVVEDIASDTDVADDFVLQSHTDEELQEDSYEEEIVYRNPVISIASMARSVVEEVVPSPHKPSITPLNLQDKVGELQIASEKNRETPSISPILSIEEQDIYEDYTENLEFTRVQNNSVDDLFTNISSPSESTQKIDIKQASGFVANLDFHPVAMVEVELDVEEPLADISFPSIEEVRANTEMRRDVNDLFAQESARIKLPSVSAVNIRSDIVEEPKWAQATSIQEQSGSEGLGDEKYATDSANFGDVDAVLNTDIRGTAQIEEKGSWWGIILIVAVALVFAVVYVLKPVPMAQTSPMEVDEDITNMEGLPEPENYEITTTPPGGRVFVDKEDKGVEPVLVESLDKELYVICVDWGTNPVCRNVSKSDLQRKGGYIFIK